jgi:probable selenium-dependent hydroxylase accessory protein YqeC
VPAAEATRARVAGALASHRNVLVIGPREPATGKAEGVSLELFRDLGAWFPDACLLNEADGSRMRPFKAPAGHEPVIPPETTLVVPVVGADVFGQTLDDDHVHRPELIGALTGAPPGSVITPEIVARVLAHPAGGCKSVPAHARVVVMINKVDGLPDRAPAHDTAQRLLRDPAIHSVVLAAVRAEKPVLEVLAR